MRHPRSFWNRVWLPWLVAALVVLAGACTDEPTGPEKGYLAILTAVQGPKEVDHGKAWRVRVRELSGFLYPDTTFLMAPVDTTILNVPLATYVVSLTGLPEACTTRDPLDREGFIPEKGTTFTIRYTVSCSSYLVLRINSVGQAVDSTLVYRVGYPDGHSVSGLAAPNDTIRFDNVAPGKYEVDLGQLAENCEVTSAGGRHRTVDVNPPEATVVAIGIICSDVNYRPRILNVGATLSGDSLTTLFLEATDPGSPGAIKLPDIDSYVWDLTDCQQATLQEGGGIYRQGLFRQGMVTRGRDTVRIAVAARTKLVKGAGDRRCVSVRVIDFDGNTTPVIEEPLATPRGRPPVVASFNAVRAGPPAAERLEFTLTASDPDGDLAGSYIQIVLKDDRVLGVGITGNVGATIPSLLMSSAGFPIASIAEVRILVMDREGGLSVAVDRDFGT